MSDQSGRNLLPNTSTQLIQKSVTNNWVRFYEYTQKQLLDALQGKGPFVARVWIDKPSVDSWIQIYSQNNGLFKGNTIKAGQSGYSTLTGEIKNDSTSTNIVIGGGDNVSVSLSYKELKLEYGDTPTPYSHAPEDLDNLINRVGGVTKPNSLPNLFPGQATPTFTVGDADSTQHLSAQRFSYIYGKECMPKTFVGIRPLKGDTIFQSCIIRISDGATLDSRITFSFFNNRTDHYTHHIVPTTITPIGQNEYRLSASYQITEDDFQLKLMDLHNFGLSTAPGNGGDSWIEIDSPFAGLVQSGGVVPTSLLQPVSFTSKWGTTLTNGISHHNKSADNGNYYDDIYYNISSFEPSTHYRLSFVAWGSGSIQTLIYPGAVLSENGKGGDGQRTWSLNAKPTEYSYEFDSLAVLYGDSQKRLLFRIPSDKAAVDFSLDTNSVVLEKVGG